MAHPNQDLARREAEQIRGRDRELPSSFYTDDHVLHYPGRNPMSGEYRGLDGLAEFGRRLAAMNVSVDRQVHDVLANDEHGIQLLTITGDRGGKRHTWRGAIVMHFRGGKISETWAHIDDQHGLDEFLS